MANVMIDSGPLDAEIRARNISKDQWAKLVEKREWFSKFRLTHDCRCIVEFIEDAELMWQELGYKSADDLIAKGYGLEPKEIRLVGQWLEINDPEAAVPLKTAIKAARAAPLAGHGGDRKKKDQGSNGTLKRGNIQAYTLRRLARDRPDLLDKVEAGELSANAAAIKAGFRQNRMVHLSKDPAGTVQKIIAFAGAEYLNEMIDMVVGTRFRETRLVHLSQDPAAAAEKIIEATDIGYRRQLAELITR